ncbi:MAG: hypothetical protein PHE15_03555, partial [Dehalococcoidales bacterium]|nr:hypothetical protein [Dehalococcoidales bacterium]
TAFASNQSVKLNDSNVSQSEANDTAIYYINKFSSSILPKWSNAKVNVPVIYYSVDRTRVAYEFTVLNSDNKDIGFIIISALKKWMPVLEWGSGKAPSSYIQYINEIAINEGYISPEDVLDKETEILYWGALTYSIQIGKIMEKNGIAYHLPTGSIVQVPVEQPELKMDNNQVRSAWASLSKETEEESSRDAITDSIGGVPAFFQSSAAHASCDEGGDEATEYPDCVGDPDDYWDNWDGCAPISGAMVLGYWDWMGYPDLSGADETLIDHCHFQMGTDDEGGTSVDLIDNGIEAVSQIYGYNFNSDIVEDNLWSCIVNEVSASRPFVLAVIDHPTYGDHGVCGWGYFEDEFILSIGVHDTWDTSDHWIQYLNWSDAYVARVIPGA